MTDAILFAATEAEVRKKLRGWAEPGDEPVPTKTRNLLTGRVISVLRYQPGRPPSPRAVVSPKLEDFPWVEVKGHFDPVSAWKTLRGRAPTKKREAELLKPFLYGPEHGYHVVTRVDQALIEEVLAKGITGNGLTGIEFIREHYGVDGKSIFWEQQV
ncbi:MAG: hypothetical protein JJ863_24660 [Deltaproteobacteria bacterium]|nr:hypothetical protein [Deltaproteobacteria bacterium]